MGDLNYAEQFQGDPVHHPANQAEGLGRTPTLARFENAQNPVNMWAVKEELAQQFIRSRKKTPAILILDPNAAATLTITEAIAFLGLLEFGNRNLPLTCVA